MPSPLSQSIWTVIVPVKQITLAKTRLAGVDDDTRSALAVAFARDTVAAAAASAMVGHVVVVSNDDVAGEIARHVAEVVPDVPDAGLNPALVHAVSLVRSRRPDASVAAISSDLPALRGEDLTHAFRVAPASTWFVPDADGIGTTMLAAPLGEPWTPAFGAGSRVAHLQVGAVELDVAGLERLRRDVDTAADLADARRLGVGPATSDVLATLERRRLP
jgi:2-phospho-L-lactate guanylyltransferase